jgi:hypothetical protein
MLFDSELNLLVSIDTKHSWIVKKTKFLARFHVLAGASSCVETHRKSIVPAQYNVDTKPTKNVQS